LFAAEQEFRIFRIPSIYLLELINGQILFRLILWLLSKWWVRGVLLSTSCRVAPTDHRSLYVWGLTLSEVWVYSPPVVELQPFTQEVHMGSYSHKGIWINDRH